MARYTGAVRFGDGTLMYFVYHGTVDTCRPKLYQTRAQADDAWDDTTGAGYEDGTPADEEPIEVMPYYDENGDQEVMFSSSASKSEARITGPRSLDSALERQADATWF